MSQRTLETTSVVRQQLNETVEAIRKQSQLKPRIGVILGSGLGGLSDAIEIETAIDYGDLPHMVQSTAPGHESKLLLGRLGDQPLVILSGRFHYYEGHQSDQIAYPVRLLQALGVEMVFITSIVGSMNPDMPPGTLVLLKDHINLMGLNPLFGPNDESLGPRFPDMSVPYDPELRKLAREVAAEQKLPLNEGVYIAVAGPNLETPAEYRFLRMIGADVVGMSVVPEVLTARHGGLKVMAVTVASDACIPETLQPANIEELLKVARETEPKLTALLTGVINRLDPSK